MANKKSRNKQSTQAENRDRESARRTRMLQIAFAAFSIILILSMILSIMSK